MEGGARREEVRGAEFEGVGILEVWDAENADEHGDSMTNKKVFRIFGCESTNHIVCKGELWECERCHKKVCWEEGSATDLVDLCDDCWYDVRVLGHEYLTRLERWERAYPSLMQILL